MCKVQREIVKRKEYLEKVYEKGEYDGALEGLAIGCRIAECENVLEMIEEVCSVEDMCKGCMEGF